MRIPGSCAIIMVLAAGCGGGGSGGGGANNNSSGSIQLAATAYDATEGSLLEISIGRVSGYAGMATVTYSVSDGSAEGDKDYANTTGQITWMDGAGGFQSVYVVIAADNDDEGPESFTFNLSNTSGATLGTISSATINIANDLTNGPHNCVAGFAGEYPCEGLSLAKRLDFGSMGKVASEDISDSADVWGWVDDLSGHEYALVALTDSTGIAVIDVTDPESPILAGNLASASRTESGEVDVKVYQNYAYVVAGGRNRGLEVFDLTRFRGTAMPATFSPDLVYDQFGEAKNLAINEQTGFAYVGLPFGGGGSSCEKGLHIVDITTPNNPMFAGCHLGVPLDIHCVTYGGPDTPHAGKPICVTTNVDHFEILDVTASAAPVMLSSTGDPQIEHFQHGWLTEDHRFFLVSDYKDEVLNGTPTRTHVFDVIDLDAPVYLYAHEGETSAVDYNLFIRGNRVYLGNFEAGLRILEFGDLASGEISEVAYFDTFPAGDNAVQGNGANSVYPYFPSGTIVVNDSKGLFVLTM